jgi:hypothetical protein
LFDAVALSDPGHKRPTTWREFFDGLKDGKWIEYNAGMIVPTPALREYMEGIGSGFSDMKDTAFSMHRRIFDAFIRNLGIKKNVDFAKHYVLLEDQESFAVSPVHDGKARWDMYWAEPADAASKWVISNMKFARFLEYRAPLDRVEISEDSVQVSPVAVRSGFRALNVFLSATPFYAETLANLLGVSHVGIETRDFLGMARRYIESREINNSFYTDLGEFTACCTML